MTDGVTAMLCAQTVEELRTLRCRRCGAPLGWTTATALVLAGGMRVLAQTTLYCPVCGKARAWRPLERERTDSSPKDCQS